MNASTKNAVLPFKQLSPVLSIQTSVLFGSCFKNLISRFEVCETCTCCDVSCERHSQITLESTFCNHRLPWQFDADLTTAPSNFARRLCRSIHESGVYHRHFRAHTFQWCDRRNRLTCSAYFCRKSKMVAVKMEVEKTFERLEITTRL